MVMKMAEYIKRDELVPWLKKVGKFQKFDEDHKRICHVIGKIIDHIEAMPAADVVEVVRCKDCAVPHNRFTDCPKLNGLIPPDNHFCGYGKRKEGADNANDIEIGDLVICVDSLYYGVSGIVVEQYCPTACEEQTIIRCIDGRKFHAPTRCFIKERY